MKQLTVFETNDGSIFKTVQEARAYEHKMELLSYFKENELWIEGRLIPSKAILIYVEQHAIAIQQYLETL